MKRATRKAKAKASRPRTTGRVTFTTVCSLMSALPGVAEGMSYGTPGFKIKGRFLARLKEDGESLVLRIGFLEREALMTSAPDIFYITDHYANYPAVLIRLPKIRKDLLARVLEEAWREIAPTSLKRRL